jgi:hypothetical protein
MAETGLRVYPELHMTGLLRIDSATAQNLPSPADKYVYRKSKDKPGVV